MARRRQSEPASGEDADGERSWAARRPRPPADGGCELCRLPLPLTFHHLIPRLNHHKRWFREHYTLEEMRLRGAWLCRRCHAFIHAHFDEATLGRRLNTVPLLLAEPLVARHVEWAARQRYRRA